MSFGFVSTFPATIQAVAPAGAVHVSQVPGSPLGPVSKRSALKLILVSWFLFFYILCFMNGLELIDCPLPATKST